MCRSVRFNPACWRCDSRRRLRPYSPEELAAISAEVQAAKQLRDSQRQARLARLRALGRPVHVVLVSCGKQKKASAAPARRFYTSTLSRLSMRYAAAVADETFILSGHHELLDLETVLEPYEARLGQLRLREREAWGQRVAGRLAGLYDALPVRVTFLAGAEYARAVRRCLPAHWQKAEPLSGLGLGRRMRWLRDELQRLAPAATSPRGSASPSPSSSRGTSARHRRGLPGQRSSGSPHSQSA